MTSDQPTPGQRLLAGLGYPFVLLLLIVLLTDQKEIRFLRFHAVQALVVGISGAVVGTAVGILLLLPMMVFPPLWPLALGVPIVLVGVILLAYLCGYRAYRGELFVVPVVATLTARFVELPSR